MKLIECDVGPAPSSESCSKGIVVALSFDGHAALLLVRHRVCESGVALLFDGDDVCLAIERIHQRCLPVVDLRDDTRGPEVVGLVHDLADLIHSGGTIWRMTVNHGAPLPCERIMFFCVLQRLSTFRMSQ